MPGETILIVDDNPVNMKLIRVLLLGEGYVVRTAGDAQEALAVLKELRPQLILMDIQLPDIDGITALAQIRTDPAMNGIPVIAVSASVMPDDQQRIAASGFDAFITKPINIRSFLETVERYAGKRET